MGAFLLRDLSLVCVFEFLLQFHFREHYAKFLKSHPILGGVPKGRGGKAKSLFIISCVILHSYFKKDFFY